MTILYAQILKLPDYKITANVFSKTGEELQNNSRILMELRNVIQGIPDKLNQDIRNAKSVSNQHNFVVKIIEDTVISLITDISMAPKLASVFVLYLVKELNTLEFPVKNEDWYKFEKRVRVEVDKFNEHRSYVEIDMELEETTNLCVEGYKMVVDRGSKIDDLTLIADRLKIISKNYHNKSVMTFLQEKYKEYGVWVFIAVVVFVLFYFFVKR
ncbi:hypothetical protein EDEG_03939 [Edhazardia aedis USNM 41457]|uniref:V-SNARE coiled-coil homology domain-containing protein n=1 Tax=Edhazardia aedis (strain USNM 41457) TaxID=1003232 RepID=J9D0S6_EDHAE|nr:hypothetical protein EDEG_03939 [Edhazardia aedis USNM 41457]|eukprot:EJW01476.1 hypothetical protein EDEG_03939 [Edhazardia aedis USNM 41457]